MHGSCALGTAILVLLGTAAAAAPEPEPVAVVLRPEAAVAQPTVRIEDVARLHGGDPALRRRLAKLDLACLTPDRPELAFPQQLIAFRIQLAGIELRAFRVEGAERTAVRWQPAPGGDAVQLAAHFSVAEIKDEDIVAAARAHLQGRLPWPAEQVQIRLAQPVSLPELELAPEERLRLAAALPGHSPLAGRVRVEVALNVNDERRGSVPVFFDVQIQQEVAVAKRRIEAGEVLNAESLHADSRAVSSQTAYPTFQDCLAGQRAKRPLAPGQVIARADLEAVPTGAAPLVRPRDAVRIVARVGELRISTSGEALQEGRAGQTIRVRNTSSNRVIQGRVVERGVVEVDF